jgi:pantetheine-phosphate adenylyltransferase
MAISMVSVLEIVRRSRGGCGAQRREAASFSLKDRLDLLRETAGKIDNVRIAEFDGLLVEFARKNKLEQSSVVCARSDLQFEFQMALMNRKLTPQ